MHGQNTEASTQDYEMGGLKLPDMAALNSALKVKQFFNATKSKSKINMAQR